MLYIYKHIKDIDNHIVNAKKMGKTIGFVPTMGALHDGHLSLIKKSKKENDLTICSIFVNPTQFNNKKDFEKYPLTLAADIEKLNSVKCDIVFTPSVAEMYPDGYTIKDKIDFGFTAATLEGEFRPGHFDGMAQIVEKLLLIAKADNLYMGQKDYQQAMICQALIKKRKIKTKLYVCHIKRETDGLAMSSRNVRLNTSHREAATLLYKLLKKAKKQLQSGKPIPEIENEQTEILTNTPDFKPEYFAVRDAETLDKISDNHQKSKVILVACWVGEVRLIDNIIID